MADKVTFQGKGLEEVKGVRASYVQRLPMPPWMLCEECGKKQVTPKKPPFQCAHCGYKPENYFLEGTPMDGTLILGKRET